MDELGRGAGAAAYRELTALAEIGRTPRDRVMLVLRALAQAPGSRKIPAELDEVVREWLVKAEDPDLSALWELTTSSRQAADAQ